MHCCRIILGEDQPFMEILHEVLRNYGRCVAHGHQHIYQSMPRMLTIWFEYGNYCSANPAPSGNKARPSPPLAGQVVGKMRMST